MRGLLLIAVLSTASVWADGLQIFCEGRLMDGMTPRAKQDVTFEPQLTDQSGRSVAKFSPASYSVLTDSSGYFSFYATLAAPPQSCSDVFYFELGNGLPRRKLLPVPLAAVAEKADRIVPPNGGALSTGKLTTDTFECKGDLAVNGSVVVAQLDELTQCYKWNTSFLQLNNPDFTGASVSLMNDDRAGPLRYDASTQSDWWTRTITANTDATYDNVRMMYCRFEHCVKLDGLCQVIMDAPDVPMIFDLYVEPDPNYQGESPLADKQRMYCQQHMTDKGGNINMTFPVRAGERVVVHGGWETDINSFNGVSKDVGHLKFFPFGKGEGK